MSRQQPLASSLPRFDRPSEAVVYWTLANLCDGAGGLFQVSIKRLARHCGLSVSTTNRAVLRLAKAGLIGYRRGVNQARPSTFELSSGRALHPSPSPAGSAGRQCDGNRGRENVFGAATAGLKIGAPTPNDNDHDLCRDTYLDDNDGGGVHKQDAHSGPDRAAKLGRTIAETLDDTRNLALYVSYCRRYPEQVIMQALQGAREPSPDKIRVSRGALFNHLCQIYGGKRSNNSHPGHPSRKAGDGRGNA